MSRFIIILLLIAGGASSLSYSPFEYIILLYLGYLCLFYAFARASSLKQSFLYGFVFGLSHFLVGTYWLFTIIDNESTYDSIILTIIVIVIILVLSLYFSFLGLFIFLIKKILSNYFLWIILIFPVFTTLMEWLRSWFLTGFTWLSPADTLVNFGFAPLLPITGTLGLSYLFYLLIAVFLYFILEQTLKVFSIFLFTLIFIITLMFYLATLNFSNPLNQTISTQIIQSHFTKNDKSKRYKVIKRLKHFQALALQEPRAELSVWAESSMSIQYEDIRQYVDADFLKLRELGVEILYGGYEKSQNVLMRNSTQKIAYNKQHLMPFGEYTPKWLLKIKSLLPNFENNDLKAKEGNMKNIEFKNLKLSPSICYELLFPEELRVLNAKANVLVHISDLGWFDNSWAQSYLLNLARMRSIEHAKPMIYVVNAGNSAFILPNGELEEVSKSTQGIQALYKDVTAYEGETPYAKYGNRPMLYGLFGLLCIYFIIGRRKMF